MSPKPVPIPKEQEKIPQFPRRLARHVPKHNNELVRFSDLALGNEGDNLLAVFKADVDSLGSHFKNLLEAKRSFRFLKETSQELDQFFAGRLDNELHQPQWSRIYTIFAGGDDLLLVGRWDLILDYAHRVHGLFQEQFGKHNLTLSAGIAFAKPKQPIKFAVEQAEELLHQAKTEAFFGKLPKDQVGTLGQVCKWSDYPKILDCGKQWKTWVNQGIAQHGWLQTLLKLGLQREGAGEDKWMATAHLAYHVARNYPRKDDRNYEKQNLRRWADQLIRDFDDQSHIETRYLPAIARYALMATRRVQEED
jgi:CRISPR-associated protein Csm1